MELSSRTKISALLAAHPAAIDLIAGINPHFRKLQNPVLRKLLAPRVTVEMAAGIGGISVAQFLQALSPLGLKIASTVETETHETMHTKPLFSDHDKTHSTELDVRPILAGGVDPFKAIMHALDGLPAHTLLRVVNSFRPSPLITILENQGHRCEVVPISANEVHTYIRKRQAPDAEQTTQAEAGESAPKFADYTNFDTVQQLFATKTKTIDVRLHEMPEPMVRILEALSSLASDECLFVHHKRMPQFLLPELQKRDFLHLEKEIEEGYVQMLILKNPTK